MLQVFKRIANTCKCRACTLVRHCHTDESRNIRTTRLAKRLFSTALFGGTFCLALYYRNKRRTEHFQAFENCRLLPRDERYRGKMRLFSCGEYTLPESIVSALPSISKLRVSANDVIVASYPKAGTTWLQEIVYLIMNGLDYTDAQTRNMEQRFPYLEYFYPGVGSIQKMKPPRLIKTHLPYSLLPKSVTENKPKILYIYRNPKDVCVSLYHFVRLLKELSYEGGFDEFFESFVAGEVAYGSFWKHYKEWMETAESNPNVLLVAYEDLQKDPVSVIQRVASFLDRPIGESQATELASHCTFSKMAANAATNYEHL